jgi:hypothetical protein
MQAAGVTPDVSFIDPMLRRRLSPLARAALHVANACAGWCEAVRFVYASRHGELGRTIELLQSLAVVEPLSPTTFGLSVLNASAGLYSIARGDHSPATAIAAGPETFAAGLLEAYARASLDNAPPTLYVYADAPAPAPFGPLADDAPGILAIALLIDPLQAVQQLTAQCTLAGSTEPSPSQAAAFLGCLQNGETATWIGTQRRWQWSFE